MGREEEEGGRGKEGENEGENENEDENENERTREGKRGEEGERRKLVTETPPPSSIYDKAVSNPPLSMIQSLKANHLGGVALPSPTSIYLSLWHVLFPLFHPLSFPFPITQHSNPLLSLHLHPPPQPSPCALHFLHLNSPPSPSQTSQLPLPKKPFTSLSNHPIETPQKPNQRETQNQLTRQKTDITNPHPPTSPKIKVPI